MRELLERISYNGTSGRRKAIMSVLKEKGIPFNIEQNDEALNIVVRFGDGAADRQFVTYMAHYDIVKGSGGVNDNGSSCAVLLRLAEHIKQNGTASNVEIVFDDREESGMYGSRLFFSDGHKPDIIFNLDVVGGGDGLVYYPSDKTAAGYYSEMAEKAGAIYSSNIPICDTHVLKSLGQNVFTVSAFPEADLVKIKASKSTTKASLVHSYMHCGSRDNIRYVNIGRIERCSDLINSVSEYVPDGFRKDKVMGDNSMSADIYRYEMNGDDIVDKLISAGFSLEGSRLVSGSTRKAGISLIVENDGSISWYSDGKELPGFAKSVSRKFPDDVFSFNTIVNGEYTESSYIKNCRDVSKNGNMVYDSSISLSDFDLSKGSSSVKISLSDGRNIAIPKRLVYDESEIIPIRPFSKKPVLCDIKSIDGKEIDSCCINITGSEKICAQDAIQILEEEAELKNKDNDYWMNDALLFEDIHSYEPEEEYVLTETKDTSSKEEKFFNVSDARSDFGKAVTIFVDGSYNKDNDSCGYGAYLSDGHKQQILYGGFKQKDGGRNVEGEIKAATEAIEYAASHFKQKKFNVYYDYNGIKSWADGEWKANKGYTKSYKDFIDSMRKKGYDITFGHVDAHTGVTGNEYCDRLAKYGSGQILSKKDWLSLAGLQNVPGFPESDVYDPETIDEESLFMK